MAQNHIVHQHRNKSDKIDTQRRIDKELDHVLSVMAVTEPASKEYKQLVKLAQQLQNMQKKQHKLPLPSMDTVVTSLTSIICVTAIIYTELNGGLFTSKAVSFVPRKF